MRFDVDIETKIGDAIITLAFTSDAPVTALVGPSGVGKSTVLNMIAGIRALDKGRIAVNGQMLFDSDRGIDLRPDARRCGYVFQDDRLFPHYRVRGNLLYGVRRVAKELPKVSFDEVVALLGLENLLNRWPESLSGGEARRVAIGRALLSSPDFLLLDEPLTSLDPDRREVMLRTVENIRENYNLPILYVSHQQDEVARIAGHVVQMTG